MLWQDPSRGTAWGAEAPGLLRNSPEPLGEPFPDSQIRENGRSWDKPAKRPGEAVIKKLALHHATFLHAAFNGCGKHGFRSNFEFLGKKKKKTLFPSMPLFGSSSSAQRLPFVVNPKSNQGF